MNRIDNPLRSIAEKLGGHRLFAGSAEFPAAAIPVAMAEMDRRVRRLRNMPSASDTTMERLLKEAGGVHRVASEWIETGTAVSSAPCHTLLMNVRGARVALASGLPPAAVARQIQRTSEFLPAEVRGLAHGVSSDGKGVDEVLALIELALSEAVLRDDSGLWRRYAKRVYRAVDAGLQFNSTTDLVRLEPVLAWVREQLLVEGRRDLAYVDVGCAAAAGAPAVCLAAKRLRPGGLVRTVHGVDVEAPSPMLARELVRTHRVIIYAADPVRRALPRAYDVVLLANVHRHLTLELQEALFGHLRDSLTEGGWLFVNWRFDDRTSPCLCLRRRGNRLVPTVEHNCV
jgi:hypothetical protein